MRALFPVLMIAATCAAPAAAQVRRCELDDGRIVFTDRHCADIGAIERARPAHPAAGARYRGGCARTLRDLVFELEMAIGARDGNRLAALYHWTGMGTRDAYAAAARLDAIAQRPLIDIVPLMPAAPDGSDGHFYPQTSVRRAPVGLRLEQTRADGMTPVRVVFGLRRHFGCWWIAG